jgi:hypothetical protein
VLNLAVNQLHTDDARIKVNGSINIFDGKTKMPIGNKHLFAPDKNS